MSFKGFCTVCKHPTTATPRIQNWHDPTAWKCVDCKHKVGITCFLCCESVPHINHRLNASPSHAEWPFCMECAKRHCILCGVTHQPVFCVICTSDRPVPACELHLSCLFSRYHNDAYCSRKCRSYCATCENKKSKECGYCRICKTQFCSACAPNHQHCQACKSAMSDLDQVLYCRYCPWRRIYCSTCLTDHQHCIHQRHILLRSIPFVNCQNCHHRYVCITHAVKDLFCSNVCKIEYWKQHCLACNCQVTQDAPNCFECGRSVCFVCQSWHFVKTHKDHWYCASCMMQTYGAKKKRDYWQLLCQQRFIVLDGLDIAANDPMCLVFEYLVQ